MAHPARRKSNKIFKGTVEDFFAIALAQELGGEVVTADHHEFDSLVLLGIVPITFIR